MNLFLSGSGGTVNIHLVNVKYNDISKAFLYHCKDPEKSRILLLGPKQIPVGKIGGSIIHSGFGIKAGTKLLDLNDKSKVDLRNRSSEVMNLL